MRTKLSPVKLPRTTGKEAWFYENARSIQVFIYTGSGTLSARIPRAKLKDWLARTEP